ncbi:tyrosine-type recombinase/integrase [Streptococcus saliviloxodontae]|uniref:Integrase n=1 Tax=Streptococcus saliviloxodontae TaxID=1349416 RepID=A0ABS2PKW1_9STRE|nr:site-specific integrase [Streptococcus saliviloxodontae]MBM7635586.1 integrase [Streptococcus saliviloxodontae]
MIKEITKKDGSTVYQEKFFLGTDSVTGKRVSSSVTAKTKRELEKKKRDKFKEFEENGSTRFKAVKLDTFEELALKWFDHYKDTVKPQTARNTLCVLEKHVLPRLGVYRIDRITIPVVQDFVDTIAKTTNSLYSVICVYTNRILKYACQLQLIRYNPYDSIIKPKKTVKKKKDKFHLEEHELKAFLSHLDGQKNTFKNNMYGTFVRFLLATGCRVSEVIALEWSDIDLQNGIVDISKTYCRSTRKIVLPKTKKSIRKISIDKNTVLMLRLYQARQRQQFNEMGAKFPTVFSTGFHKYADLVSINRYIKRVTDTIGIEKITCHAFRHTHASLLLNNGVGYKEISERLGHSNISITLDIYAHLSEKRDQETAEKFGQILAIL